MNDVMHQHIVAFFEGLDLLAPADPESTRRALHHVTLNEHSLIIDAGCGSGRQTLQLLEETPAKVVAIDLEESLLNQLQERAAAAGFHDRLQIHASDMLSPPFGPHNVDLIYSEGAVYNVGLDAALDAWIPLLKPGGCVVFSDVGFVVEEPPAEAVAFWADEYPGMNTPDEAKRLACGKGLEWVDHYWMPKQGWDAYYEPVNQRIQELTEEWADNDAGMQVVTAMKNEVGVYQRYGDSYGYYFMVLRKV